VVLLLIGLREQTEELGRHGGRNHYAALVTPLLQARPAAAALTNIRPAGHGPTLAPAAADSLAGTFGSFGRQNPNADHQKAPTLERLPGRAAGQYSGRLTTKVVNGDFHAAAETR